MIEKAIDILQKSLQICIKEFSVAAAHENQYYVLNEKFISLQLTNLHFENFDALFPVFKMVKKLEFDDCTFNTNNIIEGFKHFTYLESISVTSGSAMAIEVFLQLDMIKELNLIIDYGTIQENTLILDFKGLKSILDLRIYCNNVCSDKMIIFKGAEHLSTLENLTLECDCIIDELNKFKNLKYLQTESLHLQTTNRLASLKTLMINLPTADSTIYSLEQFPNLENLKIYGGNIICLGELKNLKILSIHSSVFELEHSNTFSNLPALQQLEFRECKISEIKNLDKLSNLKVLNLSENFTIKNIDGLKKMKNLEYLNLYNNQISDMSVLNKLPKLKEVNVAKNNITQDDLEKQLEKLEIARFLYIPWSPVSQVPFDIWKNIT